MIWVCREAKNFAKLALDEQFRFAKTHPSRVHRPADARPQYLPDCFIRRTVGYMQATTVTRRSVSGAVQGQTSVPPVRVQTHNQLREDGSHFLRLSTGAA